MINNDILWESSSNISAKLSDESDNDENCKTNEDITIDFSKTLINSQHEEITSMNIDVIDKYKYIYKNNKRKSYDIDNRLKRELYIDNNIQSYYMKFFISFFPKHQYSTVFVNESIARLIYKKIDFSTIQYRFVSKCHHLFESITNEIQLTKFASISISEMTEIIQSIIADEICDRRRETTNQHLCILLKYELNDINNVKIDQFDSHISLKKYLFNYVNGGPFDNEKLIRICESERCVQPHHFRLYQKTEKTANKKIKRIIKRNNIKLKDLESFDYE